MWRGCTGRGTRAALATALLALAGCRSAYRVTPGDAGHPAPFANAGTGSSYLAGTTITLDATGSSDPDGQIQSYHWTIVAKPADSSTSIAMPAAATTPVTLDRPGTYTFELAVTDDHGASATSSVTDVADAPAIAVDAGNDQAVAWRQTVQLAGSVQVEAGIPATVKWTFASRPARSTAVIAGDTTLAPSFVADAEGAYVVQLTASTADGDATATVAITATAPRDVITYPVVAAAYSATLDRFVLASSSPAALHVHDPETGDDVAVPLAEAPTSVSIEPTGLRAAVGQNRMLTIVDLQAGTVVRTYTVPLAIGEVAFGSDARVHCFAPVAFDFHPINSVDLASGAVTESGMVVEDGSQARISPDGKTMYVYESTDSPSEYTRYDVTTSPATYVRTARPGGGAPWFLDSGAAFVGGGNVYAASDDAALDMTLQPTLAEPAVPANDSVVFEAADDSSATGTLATVGTIEYGNGNALGAVLSLYDDRTFAAKDSILIPDTPYQGATHADKAQLVAYRSDGSKIYVLVDAAPVHAIYPVTP
jgi:hypothetical protein